MAFTYPLKMNVSATRNLQMFTAHFISASSYFVLTCRYSVSLITPNTA